jgi:translation initiation factor 2 alpha subunit (eIF-2alpha)
MEVKIGDVVLCTVKKIEKTTVFLQIEGNGEGSMVLSEVAAGRIRNLRQHVALNKKVVCKVLEIRNDQIHLSLRRVTAKERNEILDWHKKDKKLANMLKTVTNNSSQIIEKIKEEHDFVEFFEEARDDPKLLEKFFTDLELKKLTKILTERIEKEKTVVKKFTLKSLSSTGISDIQKILPKNTESMKIKYLGSSKFSITIKAKEFKEANKEMSDTLETIEKKAKQLQASLEIK